MTTPYAEVIGDPITQSKSPLIHGFWLAQLGLDADYRATRVTADDLPAFIEQRRADPAWRGCNVTMPLKLAALDLVEDRGGVRDTIGAINTVFRDGDALVGTNTDAGGFWAPLDGLDLTGRPVTVVGAGGAARAILFALSRVGVGPVCLLNRTPLRGAALLARFGLKGQALPLDAPVPACALLVNASSLGMAGQPSYAPDLSALPADAVVYDAVYHPLDTPLLQAAAARDLDTVDGLEMLVAQGALAFEIFFGQAPPRDRDDELRALLVA